MPVSTDKKKIDELLNRGVEEIIEKESLRKKLASGKSLRIKLGIDPTGADLHIGHAVPLRKLQQFQELGHQVILLIGDFTARIGDPTGRNEARPMLSEEAVKKNEETYMSQAARVLDIDKVEIRHNSEWFGRPDFTHLIMEMTSKITVARVLERDDFQKRLKEGLDIQMQEILYPLFQGYDSVALQADVELGGTDQKFNLLMGRKMQKRYEQPEQEVMTVPLLEGTDGEKKMSKTYGNYIALLDTPEDMYGKTMSIPDHLILKYYELATREPMETILSAKKRLAAGDNPRDIKKELAFALTRLYHGETGAKQGEKNFASVIQQKDRPAEIPEIRPSADDLVTVLVEGGAVNTKSEARRAIEQGGVKVNDVRVETVEKKVGAGDIIQKGKRFYLQIK